MWWRVFIYHWFPSVGYSWAFCTQVPKELVNGCSHPDRRRNTYQHGQLCPECKWKKDQTHFSCSFITNDTPHLTFLHLQTWVKWGSPRAQYEGMVERWEKSILQVLLGPHCFSASYTWCRQTAPCTLDKAPQQFPTAASGGHSHKDSYTPMLIEDTMLVMMAKAMSGLNHPAKQPTKSADISWETTASVKRKKKTTLGCFISSWHTAQSLSQIRPFDQDENVLCTSSLPAPCLCCTALHCLLWHHGEEQHTSLPFRSTVGCPPCEQHQGTAKLKER